MKKLCWNCGGECKGHTKSATQRGYTREWYNKPKTKQDCCYVCLAVYGITNREQLERDHVVPLSRGGRSVLANQIWLCRKHNIQKSAKTLQEFIRFLRMQAPG